MNNIYKRPDLYDAVHGGKTDDLDFIAGWADKVGSPVLELAAGTGRLGIPILERGHTYVGLDSSPEYVSWFKKKLTPFGKRGEIRLGDMRNFDLGQQFKFGFIGFNSLFHLMTNEEIGSCFRCVYGHLVDDGKFLIDLFIPNPDILYRNENRRYHVMEFEHPQGGRCIIREKNRYDPESQINSIRWYFYRDEIPEPELYEFDMHMIYPDTMDWLLTETGFTIEEKFGDYDGTPFSVSSPLQIYVCGK